MYLAKSHLNDKFYAIKAIKKLNVGMRNATLHQIITEKEILALCNSPFVVKLYSAF